MGKNEILYSFIIVSIICVLLMFISMQKDSQIQKLQAQVDSIPGVCLRQFGGGK